MAMIEAARLQLAARRAYEWGRLKHALRLLWVVLPLACLGFVAGAPAEALWCLTTALVVVGAWLRWKGGSAGPAVLPGVLAGVLPLAAAPLAVGCCTVPGQAAAALALVASISGAALAARAERRGTGALLISLVVAWTTACLSCTANSALMVVSATAGLLAGSFVFLLIRPRANEQ